MIKINNKSISSVYDEKTGIEKIMKGTLKVYEAWRELIASGVPPITLQKCKGVDLIDYKIYGNSVQYGNIFNKEDMLSGFIPQTGEYPTTSTSYPDAKYLVLELQTGQVVDITYSGSKANAGRIRCIDSDTNQVVASVSAVSNDYYTSTTAYYDGFYDGKITAKKNFKLGIMFLSTLPDDFDLQIKTSMPTTENPVDIEFVGEKTKNLFDAKDFVKRNSTASINGNILTTYDDKNGTVPLFENKDNLSGSFTITLKYRRESSTYPLYFVYTDGTSEQIRFYVANEFTATSYTSNANKQLKLIRSGWFNQVATEIDLTASQIENNSKATSYVPFGYNVPIKVNGTKYNIYLNEPLRKMKDYEDYIDFEKKQVIRQVKKINLKDYTWYRASGTYPFYYIEKVKPAPVVTSYSDPISNIFTGANIDANTNNMGIHPYKSGIIRVRPDMSIYDTLDKWKEYINSNNAYAIYPIADTPETIELPNIPTIKGETVIEVDTNILPSNMKVKYIGKE